MQKTRLNALVNVASGQVELLFSNPWRRISLSLISILMGFFMGSAIVTTVGQRAVLDVPAAAILSVFTELTSKIVYRSRHASSLSSPPRRRSLFVDVFNLFKIGVIYSLFLEAFKLGS